MENYDDKKKFYSSYKISNDLKNLGFNELCTAFWELERGTDTRTVPKLYIGQPCSCFYQVHSLRCSAPTLDEVTEWLRKEHKYNIYVLPRFDGFDGAQYGCNYSIFKEGDKESIDLYGDGTYSYLEAKEKAIEEVIEALKTL